MKKRGDTQNRREKNWLDVVGGALKGAAVAGIVIVLVLAGSAALLSAGVVSESAMGGMVLASCVLGCAAGGLTAKRTTGGNPLLIGLVPAGIVATGLTVLSVLIYRETMVGQGRAGVLFACLIGGALCGLTGTKMKRKKRR